METHTVRFEHAASREVLTPPFSIRLPPLMTLDTLITMLTRACWEELKRIPALGDLAKGWPLLIRSAIKAYLEASVTEVREEPGGGMLYVLAGAGADANQVGAGIAWNVARVALTDAGWEARGDVLAAELPWVLAAVMARYAQDEAGVAA